MKTSLAPGSPTAERLLRRAGLLRDLEAVGFGIVGYGCTTCIGNSGPLPKPITEAMSKDKIVPVAVLSGNRNFPGRVHAQLEAGFLASPPLVIAFALAGDVNRDILADPLARTPEGRDVFLAELWPSGAEIDAALAEAGDPADYARAYDEAGGERGLGGAGGASDAAVSVGPGVRPTYAGRPLRASGTKAGSAGTRRIPSSCWATTSPPITSPRRAPCCPEARRHAISSSAARIRTI